MQVFRQVGARFWPADSTALAIHESIPVGTYVVNYCERNGYYLEAAASFELPGKLYGNLNQRAERIYNTFLSRPSTTGVLLSGQKGSGKTLLAKRLSTYAYAHGVITVLVNQPYCGDAFNNFLAGIKQPAVVLFDEFEKVYDRDNQQKLLTLLDGTLSSRKLCVLTCNDKFKVDTYLLNRPGRLFYAIEFQGLDAAFIQDYCEDNLDNKANIRGVVNAAAVFSEFSFDMLAALVEEMNRYGETATEAMQLLNMRPQNDLEGVYTITLMRDGKPVLCDGQSNDEVKRSPLSLNGAEYHFYGFDADDASKPEGALMGTESYTLSVGNLSSVDISAGTFQFATHKPDTFLMFKRQVTKQPKLCFESF